MGRMLRRWTDKEVEVRAVFEKFRAETGVGPESNSCLPSITRVSRWGTDMGGEPTLGLAVHFGLVAGNDGGVGAAQPLPAHREAAEPLGLRNPRFYEQRQGAAPGPDEHELGPYFHVPGPSGGLWLTPQCHFTLVTSSPPRGGSGT